MNAISAAGRARRRHQWRGAFLDGNGRPVSALLPTRLSADSVDYRPDLRTCKVETPIPATVARCDGGKEHCARFDHPVHQGSFGDRRSSDRESAERRSQSEKCAGQGPVMRLDSQSYLAIDSRPNPFAAESGCTVIRGFRHQRDAEGRTSGPAREEGELVGVVGLKRCRVLRP